MFESVELPVCILLVQIDMEQAITEQLLRDIVIQPVSSDDQI